jgi:hypothetical protein
MIVIKLSASSSSPFSSLCLILCTE